MEVKIKTGDEFIDAKIVMMNGDMIVSPKVEKFEPKDGDVVYQSCFKDESRWCIYIVKEYTGLTSIPYVFIDNDGYEPNMSCICHTDKDFIRPATEEEKKKLFDKLAEEGYKWKPDTKELIKLKWKPKYGGRYYRPSFCYSGFYVYDNVFSEAIELTIKTYIDKGWLFKTEKECQELVDKLNQAIEGVKP